MPVFMEDGNKFQSIYDLNKEYWNYIDSNINGNDERIIGGISAGLSVISGISSLVSGGMKLASSNSNDNVKITINNYSEYTISICEILNSGDVVVPQFIINPGKKGSAELRNPPFIGGNKGPDFHIALDNGKESSNCRMKFRRLQKLNDVLRIGRIHEVRIDDNEYHVRDDPYSQNGSSRNMINPVYYCRDKNTEKPQYMITSTPVCNLDCEIEINIFSISEDATME